MPVVPKGQHLEDPGWWTLVDVGLLGHTFHFCVCCVGGFHQDSGSMPVLTARNRDCPTEEMKCSWLGDADGRRCRKTEWVGRLCCTETREANSRQQASARDVAGWEAGAPLPPSHCLDIICPIHTATSPILHSSWFPFLAGQHSVFIRPRRNSRSTISPR